MFDEHVNSSIMQAIASYSAPVDSTDMPTWCAVARSQLDELEGESFAPPTDGSGYAAYKSYFSKRNPKAAKIAAGLFKQASRTVLREILMDGSFAASFAAMQKTTSSQAMEALYVASAAEVFAANGMKSWGISAMKTRGMLPKLLRPLYYYFCCEWDEKYTSLKGKVYFKPIRGGIGMYKRRAKGEQGSRSRNNNPSKISRKKG